MQALLWIAIALGGLTLLYSLARSARTLAPERPLGALLAAAAVAVILLTLFTTPSRPPWSAGQSIWPGMVLGAAAVALSALLAAAGNPVIGWAGIFGTLGCTQALITFVGPAKVLDALGGYGIGAVIGGVLIGGGLWLSAPDRGRAAADVCLAALLAVLAAAATFLATFHQTPGGIREWHPHPAVLLSTAGVALAVRSVLPAREGRGAAVLTGLVVFIPVLAMAALIAFRLGGSAAFFQVAVLGAAALGLVAWLDAAVPAEDSPTARPELGVLAALVVMGSVALAFRQLQAYGIAVALLTGGLAVALSGRGAEGLGGRALALGAAFVLYRVFEESVDYRRSPQPEFYYYQLSMVVGALLPFLIATLAARRRADDPQALPVGGALLRTGLAGATAAAAPLLLWVLMGPRPQAGFLAGIAVGAGFLLALRGGTLSDGTSASGSGSIAGLLAAGMLLSAAQLTTILDPLTLWTRTQRILLLLATGAAVLAGIFVTTWLERNRGRK